MNDTTPREREDNELRLVAVEVIRKLTLDTGNISQLKYLRIQLDTCIAYLEERFK